MADKNVIIPDQLGRMIDWENGELGMEDTIVLFQGLIDSGLAWQLQGCYGRFADSLCKAGYCHRVRRPGEVESSHEN